MRHGTAADVILSVGIRIDALQVLQVAFNKSQAAPGSSVIGIHHQAVAERCGDGRIGAYYLAAQVIKTEAGWR
jgi:hypothetical protein